MFWEKYAINKAFSTLVRRKSNGLVKAVNKTIKVPQDGVLGDKVLCKVFLHPKVSQDAVLGAM